MKNLLNTLLIIGQGVVVFSMISAIVWMFLAFNA